LNYQTIVVNINETMRVQEGLIRDVARIIVWYPIRWLIIILPIRLDFFIFKILGDIAFHLQRAKRKMILKLFNRHLKPPKGENLRRFVKKYFENHFIDRLHIFLYPRLRKAEERNFITVAGLDNLNKYLSEGRGVILLHGHFGPIQLQLLEISKRGYNIYQIGLLSDDNLSYIGKKVAFRLRAKYEQQIGAKIINADKFLKDAFKILNSGGIIMMTGDGAGAGKFIGKFTTVDFLGEKVPFPVGPYSLAARTGSQILPITIHRQRYDKYCINIFEPIHKNLNSKDRDFSGDAQIFADFLQEKVRAFPCHWHFWDDFVPGKLISEGDNESENHRRPPHVQ